MTRRFLEIAWTSKSKLALDGLSVFLSASLLSFVDFG